MKTIQQIAKEINEKIKEWRQQDDRLIVVIDGYAGSGKTSVADYIAKLNPNCLVVHLDDFIKYWKTRKRMMDNAKDRSKVFEYKWYRYDAIEKLAKEFLKAKRRQISLKVYDFKKNEFTGPRIFDLSKNVLLIEGIFLLHPRQKRNVLWRKQVFLKVNLKKAEKRRIAQEKKKWGKNYLPEDHPDSYMRDFRIAYKRYLDNYKPEQKANLVINVDSNKKAPREKYKCDR